MSNEKQVKKKTAAKNPKKKEAPKAASIKAAAKKTASKKAQPKSDTKAATKVKAEKGVPFKTGNVRTFNVFVDNEYFKVEVDEIGGPPVVRYIQQPAVQAAEPAAPAAPVSPAAPAKPIPPKPVKPFVPPKPLPIVTPPKPAPAKTAIAVDGVPIISPMPGTIIRYEKQVGESVTEGETVVLLEAMKMENALPAPTSGKIKTINFKSGDSVAKDDVLCVIG